MCFSGESESGHGGQFDPCATYIKLLSEKSRLEGLCAGLKEGVDITKKMLASETSRLRDTLEQLEEAVEKATEFESRVVKLDAENAALRQDLESSQQDHLDTIIERDALKQENQLLLAENANLSMAHGPGNHTDWMLTRASKYEQLHKDLEMLRQDRDRLAGIVHTCMTTLGMTQTAWEGTNIPRGEADLPRLVRDVAQATYEKGLALKEADALAETIDHAHDLCASMDFLRERL